MAPVALMDEESGLESSGSQSDCKLPPSVTINNPDILSVNQLLESVKTNMLFFFKFYLIGNVIVFYISF